MGEIKKGKVSQIIGAVIDVAFDEEKLPNIYEALEVKREDGTVIILECQQHIGENRRNNALISGLDDRACICQCQDRR